MARTKPADQRREDLLDAAESAFVERGIAATTVGDITERAGIAKGTFYLHFESRADLVAAVQRRYAERFVSRMRAAVDEVDEVEDDWGARLDALVVAGLADHREGRPLHDVLFLGEAPEVHDQPGEVDRILAVLQEVLDAGRSAGAFDVDDTSTTAMLLFNTLHGVYNPVWTGTETPDDAALVAAAQRLFRRAAGLA